MTTAILRTPRADQERTYNAVEFAAASAGARIGCYVGTGAGGTFRGLPQISHADLASSGIDLVVAASPLLPDDLAACVDAAWPVTQVLSFATHGAEVRERWAAGAGGLVTRRHRLVDGAEVPQVQYDAFAGIEVGEQTPRLAPAQSRALTAQVYDAYRRAVADAPVTGAYAVGRDWGRFLQTTRPAFYSAATGGRLDTLDHLLVNFLRNELSSGTFGGRTGYDTYVQAGHRVLNRLRKQHRVWQYSVRRADLNRVVSPAVGNPFGVRVGAGIVHPNTFMNDYRAQYAGELLASVARPIVLDLGGGFGGFGHQLLGNGSRSVYVGVDLPENLMVASYFLMAAHPEKRVLLYESRDQVLDAETLRQYDIVMMPNFMLPQVADRAVNLFTNFISLSEMDYTSIVEYLRQVDRVCDGFFYHENVLDNGVDFEFHPVSAFPCLAQFRTVWSAPSRWPMFSASSPQHCHGECLAVRRDLDRATYLAADAEQPAPGASAAA